MVTGSSLSPPGKYLHFPRAEGSVHPTLVDCSLNLAISRSRIFGSSRFYARKAFYEHEHSLGETRSFNLTLGGTRSTYYKVTPSGRHYTFPRRASPCSFASTAEPTAASGLRSVLLLLLLLALLSCCSAAAASAAPLL